MIDPCLFEETTAQAGKAANHLRDELLENGYQEEDVKPSQSGRSRWKSGLKWAAIIFVGVIATAHIYALALRFVSPPGTILMAGQVIDGTCLLYTSPSPRDS